MSTEEERPMMYDVSPFIDLPSPLILNWLNTVLAWFFLFFYFCCHKVAKCYRRIHYTCWHFYYRKVTPHDVRKEICVLPKIPTHLCFILNLEALGGMPQLIHASSEVISWCLGAGSSQVTVYECTGCLKRENLETVGNAIVSDLVRYFGRGKVPTISFRKGDEYITIGNCEPVLSVNFMEEKDGRQFIAGLANEFTELVERGELAPGDIQVPFVHEIVRERIGEEPDLIISFGNTLDTEGFSPWLIRVSELYHLPDNNNVVGYYVFKRALFNFANVKINLGA